MKYIITEEQQKSLRTHILELLKYNFKDSNVICEIKVKVVSNEEDDDDYSNGFRYDIYVFINSSFTRGVGVYGFKVATERKIDTLMKDWMGLNETEYYVSFLTKDC
jgi:hypothetical protein